MKIILSLCLTLFLLSCTVKSKPFPEEGKLYGSVLIMQDSLENVYGFNPQSSNNCFFQDIKRADLIEHYNENMLIHKSTHSGNEIGRKVTYRNIAAVLQNDLTNQSNTEIVSKLCIDQEGVVAAANLLPETTAKLSQVQKRNITSAIMGYRYTESTNGECIECGNLTIKINKISKIRP